ncbi:MAG: hypothetical protein RhofKO_21550 [Rhodothermales bacterium]
MHLLDMLKKQRLALWLLGALGFLILNPIFLYYYITEPALWEAAMANPISLVFIAEAFILLGFGAWFIARSNLSRPGWVAFILLAIAGTLAFALPVFILWHLRKQETPAEAR